MSDAFTFDMSAHFDRLRDELREELLAELRAELQATGAPSPYMTIREAADFLRAKPQRVYDLLSSRRLSRVKDGSRTLIARVELEAYLSGDRRRSR